MGSLKSDSASRGKCRLEFGSAAFTCPRPGGTPVAPDAGESLHSRITAMVQESVPGAEQMRGQRNEKLVTQMLTDCYALGLWMHGGPSSPLNSLIIPAMRHIISKLSKLSPSHPKRVDCLSTLAHACQDCQQVQAREILRIYGDMTAQNETLELQLWYSLVRLKEAALNSYISRRHPKCDLDYTKVQPWQQRVHLMSGYLDMVGEAFGMDGVTAARSDRFLPQAKGEISQRGDAMALVQELRRDLSVEEWLSLLLADVNNQAEGAERLIDRACIFTWAQANMTASAAHLVFYDEERAEEFEDQEPAQPTKVNRYQPFLSRRVLVDILRAAGMLKRKLA